MQSISTHLHLSLPIYTQQHPSTPINPHLHQSTSHLYRFLGSHLLQQLLAAGHTVRCLCRQPNSLPPHPQIQVVIGSLSDPSSLDSLLQGTSGLFHLAGIVIHSRDATSAAPPPPQPQPTPTPTSPPQPSSTAQHPSLDQTTVDGTLAVLEAALKAGVKRVVYASTSGTVGAFKDSRQVASDDSPYAREVVGGWPYYRAKIEAEERARGYAEQHGLELVCMRPTLILGPGDYRLSSCRTVLDIMERRIPFVPHGGLSFVDVRDVASAFIAAMQFAPPNATYLLGAVNMTLYDYFHVIARCADVAPPFLFVPPDVAWILAATVSKLLPLIGRKDPSLDPVVVEMAQVYWYIDWGKAEKELGFAPRPLAERYDMATAANSVNLDKARGLEEEEEELPSHLGGGADSSAKSVNPDKARGGAAEEEEGSHWAMGGTTNDRAGSNPASNSAGADRAAEPVAGSKPGGGYFSGWTKGLSNSFSNAGSSFTNGVRNSYEAARNHAISATNSFAEGVQDSAEAARDAAVYVANNPGKTLTKSASDVARRAGRIAHKAVIEHGHEVLANTAAGLVVGGVAGGLMAGGGTIARHAHAATMEEIGSFGAEAAAHLPVLRHPPVLGQPQP
ncbi:unnamed protein product [Closterium sp. Naga37s-1]|nr:unnamed protein product [Closterium sp. Naga37s-1]